jgi:hypothetical protein
VRIALAGLMRNDAVIDAGGKAYRKMAHDAMAHSKGSVGMDRLFVENAVGAIVHNLAAIDALLDDPRRFPLAAGSTDTRSAVAMKAQLQAIADHQKQTLNVLNGMLETDTMKDMRGFEDLGVAPLSSGGATTAVAGAPMSAPVAAGMRSAPGDPGAAGNAGNDLLDMTAYGQVADEIGREQREVQQLESDAAMTIMNVAAQCSGATPNP